MKSDLIPFDDISGVNFLDKVRLLEFLMCLYRDMAVHWSLNLDRGLHQTDVTVQLSQCAIDIDNICRYRYVIYVNYFQLVQTTNKQIDDDRPKECGKTPKAPCSEETVPKTSLVPLASKAGKREYLLSRRNIAAFIVKRLM